MCKKYISCVNEHLEDTNESETEVDSSEKRIGKTKKMPRELAQDEAHSISPTQKVKAPYFNIFDCGWTVLEKVL